MRAWVVRGRSRAERVNSSLNKFRLSAHLLFAHGALSDPLSHRRRVSCTLPPPYSQERHGHGRARVEHDERRRHHNSTDIDPEQTLPELELFADVERSVPSSFGLRRSAYISPEASLSRFEKPWPLAPLLLSRRPTTSTTTTAASSLSSIAVAPHTHCPPSGACGGRARAGLEAVGFRVRRLPVGFCLRFFVFLWSCVVPDKTTS